MVDLNTDSRVSIRFTRDQRQVHLERGEAYFSVKHDPGRPFTVISPDAHITAVGTEFNVRLKAHSTALRVFKGKVRALAVPTPDRVMIRAGQLAEAPHAVLIGAGARADITAGGVVTPMAAGNSDLVSWRHQVLDFQAGKNWIIRAPEQ